MTGLYIIVVERGRDRALKTVDGLIASGDHPVTVIVEEKGLAHRIADQKPDILLIDVANPSRDVLEELTLVAGRAGDCGQRGPETGLAGRWS